jgi:hypothetical protein
MCRIIGWNERRNGPSEYMTGSLEAGWGAADDDTKALVRRWFLRVIDNDKLDRSLLRF